MNKHSIYIIMSLILLCITLGGCDTYMKRRNLEKVLGKEVVIPNDMTLANEDWIIGTEMFNTRGKVIFVKYIPETECTSCMLRKLSDYHWLIKIAPPTLFVPVIIMKTGADFPFPIKGNANLKPLGFPVYDDINGSFIKQNKFMSENKRYMNSFLLDKHGRIILVGDPEAGETMESLYKKRILNLVSKQDIPEN